MLFALLIHTISLAATPNEALLVAELDHAMTQFAELDGTPHYVAITLTDTTRRFISSHWGEVALSDTETGRYLDVDLRVGTPALDSTHPLRGLSALDGDERSTIMVPIEDQPDSALRIAIAAELERQYRHGNERLALLTAEMTVKVDEEDTSDDFSPARPVIAHSKTPALTLDTEYWESLLTTLAAPLVDDPLVHYATWTITSNRTTKTFVDTNGSRQHHGSVRTRLLLDIATTLSDGDVLSLLRTIDLHDIDNAPTTAKLIAWRTQLVADLHALADAPRGQPYSGPVLLSGRAAGVFFHEVFGHRVEGHRQKREDEGKTFSDRIGTAILPDFIDITDDPTIAHYGGIALNGHYTLDDEGVTPLPTPLVTNGRFVGFLMNRSPILDFPNSTGHGRRSVGHTPTSRMGNTFITADNGVSMTELRRQLIGEARSQGLEYGLMVDQIDGGFTTTGRTTPNAFSVRAVQSRRVFVDGRDDELIRGIDLIGTPLLAFKDILAASSERSVFNGTCGAESGWVPVSAIAPAILVRSLETQRKEKGIEQPPLLPKPHPGPGSAP